MFYVQVSFKINNKPFYKHTEKRIYHRMQTATQNSLIAQFTNHIKTHNNYSIFNHILFLDLHNKITQKSRKTEPIKKQQQLFRPLFCTILTFYTLLECLFISNHPTHGGLTLKNIPP